MDSMTAHAMVRFGLGRRGTEPLPDDPRAWLTAQLDAPDSCETLPFMTSAAAFEAIEAEGAANRLIAKGGPVPHFIGDLHRANLFGSMVRTVTTDQPFRERLVLFWANHFTVSARAGGGVLALLGNYLQDAIRPHVTGHFEDMLLAVMRHPAMLYYLNNDTSVGPSSKRGKAGHDGINENLARECLELHTLGVDGGYTQADVTNFARILTGWSVKTKDPAGFYFNPDAHEPGSKVLMGHAFVEGEQGGLAALSFLALHPATYRHIATQLVRHFAADDPAPADVAQVAKVLADTGGDLKAATLAIVNMPSAWVPLTKFRSPVDYTIAAYRALDAAPVENAPPDGHRIFDWTLYLGQPFWNAPLPNGWPDASAEWIAGDGLIRRADMMWDLAGRANAPDPNDVAARMYGDLLGAPTRTQLATSSSRREALALLLASPEFMRR
jgi:uncharacterized protein (DUF1800 family)